MDIDLLSKMVKELILDHDEVTLPGVGSFVTNIVPSSFSDKGYTINPPYRKLSFRQKQDSGDNSLVELYSSSNNVDRGQAEKIVCDFLSEMKSVLQQRKTIIFPELGKLRATKENNFFFVADEDLDIWPAGFGLEPISLKTHQETQEEVSATVAELKSMISEPESVKAEEPEPVQVEKPAPAKVETTPQPAKIEENIDKNVRRSPLRSILLTIFIILAVAAVLLLLFVILARVAPDFIDRILYTEEELRIIRYVI